jgi:hypothetical protein
MKKCDPAASKPQHSPDQCEENRDDKRENGRIEQKHDCSILTIGQLGDLAFSLFFMDNGSERGLTAPESSNILRN